MDRYSNCSSTSNHQCDLISSSQFVPSVATQVIFQNIHLFHPFLNRWEGTVNTVRFVTKGPFSSFSLSTPHSFLYPLHYGSNEDLPFQRDLLLHHFSLEVLMASFCFGEILIFKAFLNNTTGFHVAFKVNQTYYVLI